MLDRIDLMQGLNINPIPLEFGQSLTTAEWLCSIQAKVNEVITYVKNLENNANNYTDVEINKLKSELTVIVAKIDTAIKECNSYTDIELASLKVEIITKISEVENVIEEHNSEFIKVNNNINELREMVASGNMSVISPATGCVVSIQQALNDIYNNIRVTITWDTIEQLGITWDTVESWSATWSEVEYDITNYVKVASSTFILKNNFE